MTTTTKKRTDAPTTAPESTSALALGPQRTSAVSQATDDMVGELKAVQNAIATDLNEHELRLFALVALRTGLDPFSRQIHAVKRSGKVVFQTGIDGYRSTAEKTNE